MGTVCGIAGWVDFGRDVSAEHEIVRRMTTTMCCRGPDDEGVWFDKHVGIGHRRLAVIDPPGGAQPMVAESDGAPLAVLSYSGEVYNFRQLAEELVSRGHRFRTRSDTEVVLRGYLEWGAELPKRLTGMFGFAVWDVRRAELLLVRDRFGIKPLYYYPLPDGVIFGSEPKAILAHPDVRPELDREGLQELLTFANTPGHGIFKGLHQVRPGHVVRISRRALAQSRYWRLEAQPHPHDQAKTVATVRDLLEDAICGQTFADVPMCVLLSGGLDSSTVSVLASRALRDRGEGPLRSFSVNFAGGGNGSGPAAATDASYASDVAAFAGCDHRELVLSTRELIDPAARGAVVRARDLPVGFADMDTSLYLLFRAIREQSAVALSGEAADEVFGGYPWFHDPGAVAADMFPWAVRNPGAQQSPSLDAPDVVQRLELEEYIKDRYLDAVRDVPELPGESGKERQMRRVCYLFISHFLPVLLDRKDRMSMAVGLEVRVPFCDHRLVEYVFNVPWSMKASDGREKSLLRAAVTDLVPTSVLERPKSPYPTVEDPGYEQAMCEKLAELLADQNAPSRPLLDVGAARSMLAAGSNGSGPWNFRRVLIESTVRFDEWMRDYRVELVD